MAVFGGFPSKKTVVDQLVVERVLDLNQKTTSRIVLPVGTDKWAGGS